MNRGSSPPALFLADKVCAHAPASVAAALALAESSGGGGNGGGGGGGGGGGSYNICKPNHILPQSLAQKVETK